MKTVDCALGKTIYNAEGRQDNGEKIVCCLIIIQISVLDRAG